MLRNYLKIAVRNLLRNRLYSLINIFGLASGMACCLLILGYVGDELGYDRFHEKGERIYRVIREDTSAQGSIFGPNISGGLAPALLSDLPEVERAVRVNSHGSRPSEFWEDYWQSWVRHGEKVLPVRICDADPDFLELFTFPLVRGTAALEEPHTALITQEMAHKLFGLTAFMVERRSKEIGIRKVMGASVMNVTVMLSKEFTWLVVAANGVAWPIAWLAMGRWLEGFAYRIELGIGMFLLGGVATLLIAWLTVSWQAVRAALANPVEALRYE